ncbi:amidohydrolase family protein [Streptomyces sp. MS2A]|nr:amidohydrolase family protein [Streptomyces sp. MS2A]
MTRDGDGALAVVGGQVLVGGGFVPADIRMRGGVVVAVTPRMPGGPAAEDRIVHERVIDVGGLRVTPGLVDVHVHGARGHAFADADADGLAEIDRHLLAEGVTSYVASLASAPADALDEALARLDGSAAVPDGARRLGVHLEGPFLAEAQRGAHAAHALRAPTEDDRAVLSRWRGLIRMVTVAPEVAGVAALAAELAAAGVVVAVGHSDAPGAALAELQRAGATHITHLWSGQSALRRDGPWRVPGLVEASLASRGMTAEVIADGKHLPAPLLEIARRCLGADLVIVSDATAGAGMPEGYRYRLGDVRCEVRDGVGMVLGEDSFGGSTTLLPAMVRHLVLDLGWDAPQVFRMATENPARAVGVAQERGRIDVGCAADLVVWDDELRPQLVVRDGHVLGR